jgi:magnesium-transporting ATPase (P-type)
VESPEGTFKNGLSSEEANELLGQFGYNELPEEKVNLYLKFLTYFWGPIPWMIEIAALLSALVRHWSDFVIILTLLIVNSVVGFWEEYQAGNAIAALKKKLASNEMANGKQFRLVNWYRAISSAFGLVISCLPMLTYWNVIRWK